MNYFQARKFTQRTLPQYCVKVDRCIYIRDNTGRNQRRLVEHLRHLDRKFALLD
jgi:hypothetical protein